MGWAEKDYWTTQKGEVIYPKDFKDSHLINTINFIKKRAPYHKLMCELDQLSMMEPHGDAACYCLEADQIRISRMSVDTWLLQYCNIYRLLVKEAKKRNLLEDTFNA